MQCRIKLGVEDTNTASAGGEAGDWPGFVGQALGKPAGFMDAWRRRLASSICHLMSKYFVNRWLISPAARKYLRISEDA